MKQKIYLVKRDRLKSKNVLFLGTLGEFNN